MRKILILLDCDTCRMHFSKIATTSDDDPMEWRIIADNLEFDAEQSDWHCYQRKHTCPDCVLEAMHPEHFQKR